MPNLIIKLEATDTGQLKDGEIVYKFDYKIEGEESEVFCMLCDVIHLNPQFKKLVIHAIKFNREHDRENCPHCNPAKKN